MADTIGFQPNSHSLFYATRLPHFFFKWQCAKSHDIYSVATPVSILMDIWPSSGQMRCRGKLAKGFLRKIFLFHEESPLREALFDSILFPSCDTIVWGYKSISAFFKCFVTILFKLCNLGTKHAICSCFCPELPKCMSGVLLLILEAALVK